MNQNIDTICKFCNLFLSQDTSATTIANSAAQLEDTSRVLADGAQVQAATLEETTAALESIRVQMADGSQQAQLTSNECAKAAAEMTEGGKLLSELVAGIRSVNNSGEELRQAIQRIHHSGTSVTKILKTIDEIAFQTNLLALNAAVEAARAGDAGAGFAVVADEVRSLARRVAESAKETEQLVEESIRNTELGGQVNEQVMANVKTVMHRSDAVDGALSASLSNVQHVNSKMGTLASGIRLQQDRIEEIFSALEQLNRITQENASSAELAAHSSESMNQASRQLKDLVAGLETLTGARQPSVHSSTALTVV